MKRSRHWIVCLVGVALTGCGSSKPAPGVVAQNWTANTEQLGIRAIYPPRSQFEVGDVFIARAVAKGQKFDPADYVLGSVRIDHIDLSEELYRSAPTIMFQSSDNEESGSGTDKVKTAKVLPLKIRDRVINSQVAFPGFTFASLAENEVGANATGSAFAALFGGGRRSQYSVSYSVPAAETYGVTYLEARRKFDVEAPKRYSDADRKMMREAAESLQAGNKSTDDLPAALVLVTDVYLARSIDVTVSSGEGKGATFSALTLAMSDLSDRKKSLEAQLTQLRASAGKKADQPKTEGNTAAVSAPEQAEVDKVEAQLAQVNTQLRQQVTQVAPNLPGVTGAVVKSSAMGVTFRQSFAQPVAIGYRGINYSIESLGALKSPALMLRSVEIVPTSAVVDTRKKGKQQSSEQSSQSLSTTQDQR